VVPGGVNKTAFLHASNVTQVEPTTECRVRRQRKSNIRSKMKERKKKEGNITQIIK
jgi:hypothetical protein